jgi:hypothetical protein
VRRARFCPRTLGYKTPMDFGAPMSATVARPVSLSLSLSSSGHGRTAGSIEWRGGRGASATRCLCDALIPRQLRTRETRGRCSAPRPFPFLPPARTHRDRSSPSRCTRHCSRERHRQLSCQSHNSNKPHTHPNYTYKNKRTQSVDPPRLRCSGGAIVFYLYYSNCSIKERRRKKTGGKIVILWWGGHRRSHLRPHANGASRPAATGSFFSTTATTQPKKKKLRPQQPETNEKRPCRRRRREKTPGRRDRSS